MSPVARATRFLKESRSELQKVIWPTRTEVFRYTLIVVLTILISMAVIFAFDFLLIKLVQLVVVR